MKIRHFQNDGTFRPQIRDSLRALVSSDVVNTSVSRKGGYRGSITVVIGAPNEKEFEADVDLVDAGVRIIFNYSEGLLDVPSDVTVHTSTPAVELLHALYFHLA